MSDAAASSTDPTTWSTFAAVQASTVGDGFGVMLGDGLACFDLDHCLEDGRPNDSARMVLGSVRPLWVERSVSGVGLHVFVAAPEGAGWKREGVEFYSRARFIRVTGEAFTMAGRS